MSEHNHLNGLHPDEHHPDEHHDHPHDQEHPHPHDLNMAMGMTIIMAAESGVGSVPFFTCMDTAANMGNWVPTGRF